jgi:MoaA/NifB/PqqE/SkfB family radical SAM enzyme
MNKNCTWAYNDLFIGTRNNVALCCMQGYGWAAPDWTEINNLNDWYASFPPFEKIRQEHQNNIQNKECQRCWRYENNNSPSPRTRRNDHQLRVFGELSKTPIIKNIEMRFSNKCNLRCRMCDANSSSQIQTLVEELRGQGVKNNTYVDDPITYREFENIDKLLKLVINCDTIERIELAGGEPFLMPEVEWILKELVKKGRTDIEIKFITNLTSTKPRVIELLKNFKHVRFDCSIDGIGETIEYQRYPVKWKTIEKNLKFLYDNRGDNISIGFVPCISQLNLLGFLDLIDYSRVNYPDVEWGFNIVNSPSYLDFRLVPLEYRKELFSRLETLDISFMKSYTQKIYKKFFDNTVYEFRDITEKERKELRDAMEFWDYKSSLKSNDYYPWLEALVNE